MPLTKSLEEGILLKYNPLCKCVIGCKCRAANMTNKDTVYFLLILIINSKHMLILFGRKK